MTVTDIIRESAHADALEEDRQAAYAAQQIAKAQTEVQEFLDAAQKFLGFTSGEFDALISIDNANPTRPVVVVTYRGQELRKRPPAPAGYGRWLKNDLVDWIAGIDARAYELTAMVIDHLHSEPPAPLADIRNRLEELLSNYSDPAVLAAEIIADPAVQDAYADALIEAYERLQMGDTETDLDEFVAMANEALACLPAVSAYSIALTDQYHEAVAWQAELRALAEFSAQVDTILERADETGDFEQARAAMDVLNIPHCDHLDTFRFHHALEEARACLADMEQEALRERDFQAAQATACPPFLYWQVTDRNGTVHACAKVSYKPEKLDVAQVWRLEDNAEALIPHPAVIDRLESSHAGYTPLTWWQDDPRFDHPLCVLPTYVTRLENGDATE